MKTNKLISTVLDEMRKMSQAKSVVGTPIEIGETRVVPVSELSVGFGSGRGQGRGAHSENSSAQAQGAGAGGMVQINPLGFIVVGPDGRAQIQSLKNHRSNALAKAVDLIPKIVDSFAFDSTKAAELANPGSGSLPDAGEQKAQAQSKAKKGGEA